MNLIDLHTHTTFSDGTFTPQELMEYASQKGLKAIAVTDHDTIEGCESAANWAAHYNIEFIPGVEVESPYDGIEIHILGLFIDPKNKGLLQLLESLRQMRSDRDAKIIEILNSDGITVTLKDIQAVATHKTISRPHFAKFLVLNGYYDSISDAMRNYLGRGKRAYVPRPLPPAAVVFDTIKNAGGIPILAHPVQYRLDYAHEERMIEELKSYGLSGLEAIYSENKPEDTAWYLELAKKHSLLISGGSDFHGEIKPGLDLGSGRGELQVGYEVLEALRNFRD